MSSIRFGINDRKQALGVIYSGEALYCKRKIPIWGDSERGRTCDWRLVIPKMHKTKNAEAFINHLPPDIAKWILIILHILFPTLRRELIEDASNARKQHCIPDISQLKIARRLISRRRNEIIYNQLWREIKSKWSAIIKRKHHRRQTSLNGKLAIHFDPNKVIKNLRSLLLQ